MGKKIGICSDIHGNFFAMQVILQLFTCEQVDEIIHCGDVVSMGPHSKECLDVLLNLPNCALLLGNHDFDYLNNNAKHLTLSHISAEHKEFVFKSLGETYKQHVARFPKIIYRTAGSTTFAFCHYALNDKITAAGYLFKMLDANPNAEKFDNMFDNIDANVIFFGHKHEPCDISGKKLYVDVGSVGCYELPLARGIILEVNDDGTYNYKRVTAPYDRDATYNAMIKSGIPDAQYIFKFYFDRSIKD